MAILIRSWLFDLLWRLYCVTVRKPIGVSLYPFYRAVRAGLTLSLAGFFCRRGAEFIGVTAALKGEVLRVASLRRLHRWWLSSGEKIYLGDEIKVAGSGRLQVMLVVRQCLRGSGAEMVIDQFVYDPNQANQLSANIKKGAFRFVSEKLRNQRDAMKVAVPGATIMVRGHRLLESWMIRS